MQYDTVRQGMDVTKRKLLAAGAGTIGVGGGAIFLLSCNENFDKFDESYIGSEETATGSMLSKSRDGSSVTFSSQETTMRVEMKSTYYRDVNQIDTGSCVTVTGVITDVHEDGEKTDVNMEMGEVQQTDLYIGALKYRIRQLPSVICGGKSSGNISICFHKLDTY